MVKHCDSYTGSDRIYILLKYVASCPRDQSNSAHTLYLHYTNMYHRIQQLRPPFVHASIGQNGGGGLFAG